MQDAAPVGEQHYRYQGTAADRRYASELLHLRPEVAEHYIVRAGTVARDLAAELGIVVEVSLLPPGLPPVRVGL